jgi:hypothetical protein
MCADVGVCVDGLLDCKIKQLQAAREAKEWYVCYLERACFCLCALDVGGCLVVGTE